MNTPIAPHGSDTSIAGAIDWINGVLLGSVAIALCVLAVALVGLLMLGGRLPVRHGMRVVLGCFVLLGAPAIAAGIAGAWQEIPASPPLAPATAIEPIEEPRADLPPADYDPYAGASLRRD